MPALGPAAFRSLPLTEAFQSTFPSYRQRSSFGRLGGGGASQLDTAVPQRLVITMGFKWVIALVAPNLVR